VSLAGALDVSASWLAYGIGDMHINGAPATCAGMGARLQQLRVEQGHTKAALARLVGLSPSTVADIENGAQTGVEVIEALAKAVCISPAWLVFNQGSRELPVCRRAVTEAESAQASD
jgi:transcriptional regulator with XRE-family HTH domain